MGKDNNPTYPARAAAVEAAARRGEWAVGRIRKEYGRTTARGEGGALQVSLYDGFPEDPAAAEEPLWTVIDTLAVPLYIASFERQSGGRGLVVFDDFATPAETALLVGKTLYRIPAAKERDGAAQRESDEDFGALIGYELTDRHSGRVGIVRAFYDYPGNPLLGVDFEGREVLVPAADGIVEVASVRKKQLTGDLPEGLFDL